jgi:alkylation response protein AidB-like acyl-CoA dehydrogenase
MSEPDVGSDLASVRCRAERVRGGWKINGTKIWTTHGHRVHYLIALIRTAPVGERRHEGLTQFLIDLSRPGIHRNPIKNLAQDDDFCEIVFDDYFAEEADILGKVGKGWELVTHELAQERSGPERFLSDFVLFLELLQRARQEVSARKEIGRLVARLQTLREMSISIAGMLARGRTPELEAALVKDLGTQFERDLPEQARIIVASEPRLSSSDSFDVCLGQTILYAPSFTLRGGTREVLRGIIAKYMGVR